MTKKKIREKTPDVTVKLPKKIFVIALIALVVTSLVYFGGKLFIAASVNGQLISRLSVIKNLEKQGGQATLDTIILKALINQEAKKRKINISEKEINTEISKIENNVTSQGTTLDALLLQQGMTKKDLIDEVKMQLLVTKMADNNISISDKEIADYISGQKEQSSLNPDQPAEEITENQAKEVIKQQKLQEKVQTLVADLKAKAKINYFINY